MLKKLMKFVLPSLAFFPLVAISCQNNQELKNILINNENQKKWDQFLSYDYIKSLLKIAFNNNKQKIDKYIEDQKNINEKDYISKLKSAFLYASNPTSALGFDSDDGFLGFGGKKPYLLENGEKIINELLSKNWLWYLFNLDKFTFAYYPEFDKFESTTDNSTSELLGNSLKLGSFYKPKKNKISQFVIQKYNHEEDWIEDRVYLLTEEGFIIKISVDYDEDNLKNDPQINILGYIQSYPKLVSLDKAVNGFNIAKYVETSEAFASRPNNRVDKILFEEEYEGKLLRYSVVDVN
ncbi:aromatic motif membrane protein [Mycoplasma struthionis]|nr:aromatic motif membrane protein [Mycoplasma struthionis]